LAELDSPLDEDDDDIFEQKEDVKKPT